MVFAGLLNNFRSNAQSNVLQLTSDAQINVSYLESEDKNLNFGNPKELITKLSVVEGTGQTNNPFRLKLLVKNAGNQNWSGMVRIDLKTTQSPSRFFLPGYLYVTNNGESDYNSRLIKQFQRLDTNPKGTPYSSYWMTRSDQLTHPVAMMYAGEKLLGISGIPFSKPENAANSKINYDGFVCSAEQNGASVAYTLGYRYAPGNYMRPHEFEKFPLGSKGDISIYAGTSSQITFEVYAFAAPAESEIGRILENVYKQYHVGPRNDNSVNIAAKDISSTIFTDSYSTKLKTYALITRKPLGKSGKEADQYPMNVEGAEEYVYNYEGLISWTNGTVIAVPLLQASYRLENKQYRQQALEIIQNIVDHSVNPRNGIPFCTKVGENWTNKGWWTGWVESENNQAEHSSYIVGQALYYIMKAYHLEASESKVKHDDWLGFVKQVLQILAKTQNAEGAFPRFWSEESIEGKDYTAFSGCWVAAAMANYSKITGDNTFLEAAKKAETYYFKSVEMMECNKTPLDVADAADAEGILAYIRLVKILHEKTGNSNYLSHLKTGIDYELIFKFCYNTQPTSLPLSGTGWSSCGGTITSVCNAVVHCMSNSILDELYYYCQKTGDSYYQSRLRDTWLWGLQTYNRKDNEYFFGKKGWSTEYFSQADRHVLDIRLPDNTRSNLWFAYHPWAPASILEGILGELWGVEFDK